MVSTTEEKVIDPLEVIDAVLELETDEMDDKLSLDDIHKGAASEAHLRVDEAKVRCEHLGLLFLGCLSMFSFVPLVIYESMQDLNGKDFLQHLADEYLSHEHSARITLLGHLIFIPFVCPIAIFILWNIEWHLQQGRPSKIKVFCQAISLTTVSQLRVGVDESFKAGYKAYIGFYIDFALWVVVLSIWFSSIKVVRSRALGYLRAFDEAVTSHAPYKKQLSIMLSFTKFQDKKGKNAIYSFNKPHTACEVLELYVLVYYLFSIALPCSLFACWYFGVDMGKNNFLFLGVLGLISSGMVFFTTGMRNLTSIVISKPFYLGDIIEVGSIIGFVENFTWSHIVIRDFGCKQTWIAHTTFQGQTVLNWTRRNTKPILVQLSLNAFTSAGIVQEFVAEATKLVKSNEKINQNGYIKVCISSMESGYVLTALFFPGPGQQKKVVREGFLLDVMRVAAAKKIELVPSAIMTSFAKSGPSDIFSGVDTV